MVLGQDGASGLAVVRVQGRTDAPLVVWTPRQLDQPRYVLAGEFSEAGLSLRPTFVGSLQPTATAMWPDPVWVLPTDIDVTPGAFLFTTSGGEFVGMVIARDGTRAVVPGATVLAEADRIREAPRVSPGTLGVNVQALTPGVAMVTGSSTGVVVTSVARGSPAAGHLSVGDVIEEVDGRTLRTLEQWDVRMGRLGVEEKVNLRLRRRGQIADVSLTARGTTAPPSTRVLGLALRRRTAIGAAVDSVEAGSAGGLAGLMPGDVITLIDDAEAPTPARVTRTFASLRPGQHVLLAVARGAVHFVTTLER
jgi:serine protease DegQ